MFYVKNEQTTAVGSSQKSYEDARDLAKSFALRNPNAKYYILQAIESIEVIVSEEDIKTTRIDQSQSL